MRATGNRNAGWNVGDGKPGHGRNASVCRCLGTGTQSGHGHPETGNAERARVRVRAGAWEPERGADAGAGAGAREPERGQCPGTGALITLRRFTLHVDGRGVTGSGSWAQRTGAGSSGWSQGVRPIECQDT